VVGAFVVFTGITLVAALFHPDEKRAARAMEILKELLRLFRQGVPVTPATVGAQGTQRLPGRPRRCPDDVLTIVVDLRISGARLIDICDELNALGMATPGGGSRWWPSHVHRLLRTRDGSRLLSAARNAPSISSESVNAIHKA
jgi:hypothetical protein